MTREFVYTKPFLACWKAMGLTDEDTKTLRLLIEIPLFLLITLIAAAFLYLNYTSIMSSANDTLNRFLVVSNDGKDFNPVQESAAEREKQDSHENAPEKPKGDADNNAL